MAGQEMQSRFGSNGDGSAPWEENYQTQQERDSSLGELLKRLSNDTGDLIGQEIALAKAELKESAANVGKGVTKFAVAWMFGMTGFLALTACLIVAIGGAMGGRYAISALIVGVVEMIIAAIAANGARKSMRPSEIKPAETIQAIREDTNWAKREAKDLKRNVTASPAPSHQNREG
jgi:uncharacterized membrane protein YqjE